MQRTKDSAHHRCIASYMQLTKDSLHQRCILPKMYCSMDVKQGTNIVNSQSEILRKYISAVSIISEVWLFPLKMCGEIHLAGFVISNWFTIHFGKSTNTWKHFSNTIQWQSTMHYQTSFFFKCDPRDFSLFWHYNRVIREHELTLENLNSQQ